MSDMADFVLDGLLDFDEFQQMHMNDSDVERYELGLIDEWGYELPRVFDFGKDRPRRRKA